MRELTRDEQLTLARRRQNFSEFYQEMMPVLADFAEAIGAPNPPMIVAEPEAYLPLIDEFMVNQEVDEADRVWVLTRLGYFIGEILVSRLGGCWFLNENPDSMLFLRYVVGRFKELNNPNISVDVFEAASNYLDKPIGRSLTESISEIERECRAQR